MQVSEWSRHARSFLAGYSTTDERTTTDQASTTDERTTTEPFPLVE